MSTPDDPKERLRKVRDEVRDRALLDRPDAAALPPAHEVKVPGPMPPDPAPAPLVVPPSPDTAAVNELWKLDVVDYGSGWRGSLARFVASLLAPLLVRQQAFNSRQVQLDNQLVAWADARHAETHRHYDGVLGIHGRHMGEIDERHFIVQEELVAHVHDLVKRIDLVLSESERGRLSGEAALRDVRARLSALEERIARG